MIHHVCWLASLFVNTAAEVISGTVASPIFMKFGTDVQRMCHMSLLTCERSRSKFKVKPLYLVKFCTCNSSAVV